MNVTYIYADKPHEWNSSEWRCAEPARALNRTRRHRAKLLDIVEFAMSTPVAQYACEDADVIIMQRGALPDTWDSLRYWRGRGKLVLADIDDGYPQITPEHPAYAFWHQGIATGPEGQRRLPRPAIHDMAEGLTHVAGLTSPNKLILKDWLDVSKVPGAFVPNYMPISRYKVKRTRAPEDDGVIWVAWGGSFGHFGSWQHSGIAYALARVISKRPNVRFIMCGADTRVVDSVPLKTHQKINIGWQPPHLWLQTLVNFDVGLIPVAGEFDARRSWLKPQEYSALNVPWISSKSPAYDGLEDFGAFVENTPDEWAAALEDALDHGPDLARVRRARRWAESLDIDANVDKITQAYHSLK